MHTVIPLDNSGFKGPHDMPKQVIFILRKYLKTTVVSMKTLETHANSVELQEARHFIGRQVIYEITKGTIPAAKIQKMP